MMEDQNGQDRSGRAWFQYVTDVDEENSPIRSVPLLMTRFSLESTNVESICGAWCERI